MPYLGEVVTEYVKEKRIDSYVKEGYEVNYFFRLVDGLNIDATKFGNESRFANHSCDANMHPDIVSTYECSATLVHS